MHRLALVLAAGATVGTPLARLGRPRRRRRDPELATEPILAGEPLEPIVAPAVYTALAPFAGRRVASQRAANPPRISASRPRVVTPRRAPAVEQLQVTELTRQTVLHLVAHPEACNVDIARAVGVRHESQMSRHLRAPRARGDRRAPQGGPHQRVAAHGAWSRDGTVAHVTRRAPCTRRLRRAIDEQACAVNRWALIVVATAPLALVACGGGGIRPGRGSGLRHDRSEVLARRRLRGVRARAVPQGVLPMKKFPILAATTLLALLGVQVGLASAADQLVTRAAAPAPADADSCPNAAIRAQQQSEYLPDCGAYEMVSPADKGGGSINDTGQGSGLMALSRDGDRATFASYAPFAGAPHGMPMQYVADRTGDGWVTRPATPAPGKLNPNTAVGDAAAWSFTTPDLTFGVLTTNDQLDPTDTAGSSRDLYGYTSGTSANLISRGDGGQRTTNFAVASYAGMSEDGRAVYFTSPDALASPAEEGADGANLYVRSDGHTSVINQTPTGISWATAARLSAIPARSAVRDAMSQLPATAR